MAAKKGKGAKKAIMAGSKNTAREELLLDAGGFDWGWPAFEMVIANDELTRRLMAGGFSGCGYGAVPDGPSFISLFGDNLSGMKSALALMKDWTTLSGPNAIRFEIAYDKLGYVLAISQQVDLLRWRLSGIDTVSPPLILTMGHIKRMDSRHPVLDQLAEYAQQPVAPLWLIVNQMPKSVARRVGSCDYGFVPQWDNAILLPGISIYRTLADRPADSMARIDKDAEPKPTRKWPPDPEKDPARIAAMRERRLSASFPKTLHSLRNTDRGAPLFEHGQTLGCTSRQVEQAICNLRSAASLAYQPSSIAKRLAMIQEVRNRTLEPASMTIDFALFSNDQLTEQLALDAGYLLRRLEPDRRLAETASDRIDRIRELGYG